MTVLDPCLEDLVVDLPSRVSLCVKRVSRTYFGCILSVFLVSPLKLSTGAPADLPAPLPAGKWIKMGLTCTLMGIQATGT